MRGLGAAFVLSTAACTTAVKGPAVPCHEPDLRGCVIDEVTVVGNEEVSTSELTKHLATSDGNHPLFGALEHIPVASLVDRIIAEDAEFEPFVLQRDLSRVERIYRAHGFYDAHARAARVEKKSDGKVRITIVVDEGKPVSIERETIVWTGEPPAYASAHAARAQAEKTLPIGKPLSESGLEEARRAILRFLLDNGYAYAKVESHADADLTHRKSDVTFTTHAGPSCRFGAITIHDQGSLPEDRIRSVLQIREGDAYSQTRLEEAERALTAFGVFSFVELKPNLSKDEERAVVPVEIHVVPNAHHGWLVGPAGSLGSRVETHLALQHEDLNAFGRLLEYTATVKAGVIAYPYTIETLFDQLDKPTDDVRSLPQLSLQTTLAQRGFLDPLTRGQLFASVNASRLFTTSVDKFVLGNLELMAKAGVERPFWNNRVSLKLYGSFQSDHPFSYLTYAAPNEDTGFSPINVPVVQATAALDLRYNQAGKHDPLRPHRGIYFATDTQVAFADAQDLRIRPQLAGYVPLARGVALALRLDMGFLFPFGGALKDLAGASPDAKGYGHYLELLWLRGFMSGGDQGNRGYYYGDIGPHEVVKYLSATLPNNTLLPLATGGTALWQSSVEVRFYLVDDLSMAVFLDGSDVTKTLAEMSLKAPHLSTGFGFRYDTAIGPLRADFGFRPPLLQVWGVNCSVYEPGRAPGNGPYCAAGSEIKGAYLDPKYGTTGTLSGVPVAFSFALGEAF